MICAYCKSRVFESDRKCQSCGSTVFIAEMEIPAQAAPGADAFAPEVIFEVLEPRAPYGLDRYGRPYSSRNRWIAFLFCVFGGWVGLHRFYTGRVAGGIVFLLTGGVFGIGVFVDAMAILFGSFRDRQGCLLHSRRL